MKKSLVALAVLAATGAYAQSSVTLYGRAEAGVDLGFRTAVDSTRTTVTAAGVSTTVPTGSSVANPGFRIQDGNNQGSGSSRFGMRGTEDLGGGLKANFVLEAGVNLDDGTSGNGGGNLFSRSAWVGLQGSFGEVRMGRLVLGSFGVHASGLAPASSNGLYETGATMATGGVRFANAIQYRSPDFGGISGTFSLQAPEANGSTSATTAGVTNTTNTNPKAGVDLSLAYANGPLYVGFGYNKQDNNTSTNNGVVGAGNIITNTAGPRTDYTLSASYNFGMAQPFFNYTNRKDASSGNTVTGGAVTAFNTTSLVNGGTNTNSSQYALGVKVPFGAATLITSFGSHKTTGSAVVQGGLSVDSVERKVRAFQIGGQYALSKRTMFQANYGLNNTDDVVRNVVTAGGSATANTSTKTRGLNVGVSHLF